MEKGKIQFENESEQFMENDKNLQAMNDYDKQREFIRRGMAEKLLAQIKQQPIEKDAEQEKLLNELGLCAEVFIGSSFPDKRNVYCFYYDELKQFLMLFADGAITQMERNKK